MAQDEKTIYVYENWRGEAPTLLGRLRCGFVRGQETFSFAAEQAALWPVFRLLSGSLGASADEAQGGHRRSQRGPQAP